MSGKVKKPRRLFPLRRVVKLVPRQAELRDGTVVIVPGLYSELLECGHTIPQKQDLYGPTNAYRRRCRLCGEVQRENGDG